MDSSYIYTLLSGGVSDKLTVKRIVRGLQWTAAELSDGSMGIAMRYPSETIPRMHNDTLVGLSAREAAEAVLPAIAERAETGYRYGDAFRLEK